MEQISRGYRKTRIGEVVSDKMDKTIVVAVEDHVKHPLYKKIVGTPSPLRQDGKPYPQV